MSNARAQSSARPAIRARIAPGLVALAAWFCFAAAPPARGEQGRGTLDGSRALIIYNHCDPDSLAVRQAYQKARPSVQAFDLAEPRLVGRHTINYESYKTLIQRPIRAWLAAEPGRAERFVALILTRGLPHRIADMDKPRVGDAPALMRAEWLEAGDFTAASVDSELTLLWRELDRGEKGGSFDSAADGFVANPFYGSTEPITAYRRRWITGAKALTRRVFIGAEEGVAAGAAGEGQCGWAGAEAGPISARLSPGDIHLVGRIDGATLADALALIERGRAVRLRPSAGVVVLDAAGGADLDRGDYARAAEVMRRAGWRVVSDRTDRFLTGADIAAEVGLPVIAYASYGRNDPSPSAPASQAYIRDFRFGPGAVFNTLESFNGKDLGGAGNRLARPQTQIADFIAAGGSFGIGSVWEPFAFSAADNELLLDGFFNRGLTWIEAAYRSLKALSWQQIVVGDPLARVELEPEPPAAPEPPPAGSSAAFGGPGS